MRMLRKTYPGDGFESPGRPPVRITLLGAGAVGGHVVQTAVRYGDDALRRTLAASRVPGVLVTIVDYDLTGHGGIMRDLLTRTDILVDATQRPDPGQIIISNECIGLLPEHAIVLDLSVDPDDRTALPVRVKGIEGIPQGTLDQIVFAPDDPAFEAMHDSIGRRHRRHVVSCYSWPGIYPEECMEVYGRQLQPLLRTLVECGGADGISQTGMFFERALARAQLSRWKGARAAAGAVDA